MKTRRRTNAVLWTILFLLIELPALPCGPDWPTAVFVKKHGPDTPYRSYAQGRLGIPQQGYRTRHLLVLYRYLSGEPLSADEQTAAIKADALFNSSWETRQQNAPLDHPGFYAWVNARKSFGPVDDFVPDNPLGTGNAFQFDAFFDNCLDDAFANATHTLNARLATFGRASIDVREWVRGQDTVFHNCQGGHTIPAKLPTAAPLWLQQDRAYQTSAALFYQGDYDSAIAGFRSISGDAASPWSVLARYLVGRILVTRAIALEAYYPPPGADLSKEPSPEQRRATYIEQLTAARAELETMRADPRMHTLVPAIDSLIDRVNARLEPEVQSRRLAGRLTTHAPDPKYFQDTIDLSYLLSDASDVNDSALRRPPTPSHSASAAPNTQGADLLLWLNAFRHADEPTSLAQWHTTHSKPWLLAALSFAKPGDPGIADLIAAARAIPPSDPAYAATIFHALRLAPVTAGSRTELLAVLPRLSPAESTSTRNQFAELNARSAPDLDAWLREAGRRPAAISVDDEEDAFDTTTEAQPCGPATLPANTPLFAPDVATVLNTRMPLHLLAESAASPLLPSNLQFQIAHAAWTRALLLNRRDIALQLAPILIRCHASWKPVLDGYANARSPDDRKAAALFALMRFASTEPNVREGEQRPDGFANYSEFRDNWWCSTVPPEAHNNTAGQPTYDPDGGFGFTSPAHPEVPDPLFLTDADKAEIARELAQLRIIPKASDYFAIEAIAWQHAHPHDPRSPDLLGQAFRVQRNACSGKVSEKLIFDILHSEYPDNRWTQRYTSWSAG